MNPLKNWRTTLSGLIAALLLALGIFMPEKLDPETQVVLNAAAAQILTGVGAIVAFITTLIAKDPV